MNGIEKITARISAEAKAEADAVISEAEGKAAAIAAEYGKKAEEAYSAKLSAGKNELEQQIQRAERRPDLMPERAFLPQSRSL